MGDSNRPTGRFESKPFRGKQRAVRLKGVRKYRVERLFRRIAASAQTALFVNLGLFVVPRPRAQLRENVRGVVAGPAPARDDAALAPLNQKVKNAAFFQFRGRRVERYSLADRAEIQFDPLLLKRDRTRRFVESKSVLARKRKRAPQLVLRGKLAVPVGKAPSAPKGRGGDVKRALCLLSEPNRGLEPVPQLFVDAHGRLRGQ